jgi:hypothetical protein
MSDIWLRPRAALEGFNYDIVTAEETKPNMTKGIFGILLVLSLTAVPVPAQGQYTRYL